MACESGDEDLNNATVDSYPGSRLEQNIAFSGRTYINALADLKNFDAMMHN